MDDNSLVDRLAFRNALGLTVKSFRRALRGYVVVFGEVEGITERKVPAVLTKRVERAWMVLKSEAGAGLSMVEALEQVRVELGVARVESAAVESAVVSEGMLKPATVLEPEPSATPEPLEVELEPGAVEETVVETSDADLDLRTVAALMTRIARLEAALKTANDRVSRLDSAMGVRVKALELTVPSFKLQLVADCASAAHADQIATWLQARVEFRERWLKRNMPVVFERIGLKGVTMAATPEKGKTKTPVN